MYDDIKLGQRISHTLTYDVPRWFKCHANRKKMSRASFIFIIVSCLMKCAFEKIIVECSHTQFNKKIKQNQGRQSKKIECDRSRRMGIGVKSTDEDFKLC